MHPREDAVVEDDVEFAGAGCDGGAGFAQLLVGVLGAFVEADDAGYDDVGAFEVGDAALDPVEADAYALRNVSISSIRMYMECAGSTSKKEGT